MFTVRHVLRFTLNIERHKLFNEVKAIQSFSSHTDRKRLHFDKDGLKNDEITFEELELKKEQKHWSEDFGTLTNLRESTNYDEKVYEEDSDNDDDKPYIRLAFKGRKHTADWYGRKLEKLGKKGMVYEAIQLLEEQMIATDRVRPNEYVFNTLIGILGRTGYTYKAFKYFNMMKKYGLQPSAVTYTALFNACSNCPSKEEGLNRALKLKDLIDEKGHELNIITYHSIVKAFSLCGDREKAFQMADEAVCKGFKITSGMYAFLLMACIEDKTSGFTLAIKLCEMMKKEKRKMNIYQFNLLLRVVRECNVGSQEQFESLLHKKQPSNVQLPIDNNVNRCYSFEHFLLPHNHNKEEIAIPALTENSFITSGEKQESDESQIDKSLTLLDKKTASVASLAPLPQSSAFITHMTSLPRLPHHRLLLLGGVEGFLKVMQAHKATPDIKTFALLLDCIPGNFKMEELLLDIMTKTYKIRPDTAFCNLLIRKRNLRGNFKAAKDVFALMTEKNIKHDMKTYGCLAMGCSTVKRAIAFLEDMKKMDLLPNAEILNILLTQAKLNFRYKRNILLFVIENKLRLYERTLSQIEKDISTMKDILLRQQKIMNECKTSPSLKISESSLWINNEKRRDFENFLFIYKQWLRKIPIEPLLHPYDIFKQPTIIK